MIPMSSRGYASPDVQINKHYYPNDHIDFSQLVEAASCKDVDSKLLETLLKFQGAREERTLTAQAAEREHTLNMMKLSSELITPFVEKGIEILNIVRETETIKRETETIKKKMASNGAGKGFDPKVNKAKKRAEA